MGSKTRSASELKSLLIEIFNNSETNCVLSQLIMENVGQLIKTEVSHKLEMACQEINNLKTEVKLLKDEVLKLNSDKFKNFTLRRDEQQKMDQNIDLKTQQRSSNVDNRVAVTSRPAKQKSSSTAAFVTDDPKRSGFSFPDSENVNNLENISSESGLVLANENDKSHNKQKMKINRNDDFKLVTRKKRRKPEILGKNTTSNLKGVAKMASVYVSRIDASSSLDSVSAHLKENGFTNFDVKLGYSKYPELYQSYVVTVPATKIDEIKRPDLWPEGACVSNFLYHLVRSRERKKLDSDKVATRQESKN